MRFVSPFSLLIPFLYLEASLAAATPSPAPTPPRSTASAPAPSAASSNRPNIVFIFADDWGWGDLSCHGHPTLETPNIDRLAREGTDFRQFNVLNPVCSPSRTAVMTGMFPARFGVHQHFAHPALNRQNEMPDWLDPRAPTLPRFLKQAGYRTGHFGKWHLTNRQTHGAPEPQAYGYDEALVFNGGAEWPSAELHATADNTIAFIRARGNQPFFVNVWLHESHTPHVPTAESMQRWTHLDEQRQVYSAVITDGDKAVGKILDALRSEGLEENTIVLFSSDNGPESTAKNKKPQYHEKDSNVTGFDTYYSVGNTGGLRGRKRSLFEGGVRVPFIVRWPAHIPAGAINDRTVITAVDVLPTLCAAAGVTLPENYRGDGENLLEALLGKSVLKTRPIFWEWRGTQAEPDWWPRLAVREGDWKLLMNRDATRVSLHRLDADRRETMDASADNPAIVTRLSKLALDWKGTLPSSVNPSCVSEADRAAAPQATTRQDNAAASRSKTLPIDRAKAFERLDSNKDGWISREEYAAGMKGIADHEQRFLRFDSDADGRLSRTEFVTPGQKR